MKKNDIKLDFERYKISGLEEAILAKNKSINQLEEIIEIALNEKKNLFFTKLNLKKFQKLTPLISSKLIYDKISRTACLQKRDINKKNCKICIVAAGTSDLSVVEETSKTLNYYGFHAKKINDVGVAGIWRLFDKLDEISKFPIVIVVAGMEGALSTVLSGLIKSVIIAIPTSNGYGLSKNGKIALKSILSSCSPGILTVNIDNGFGAACAALRILHSFK